jgi:hypothetical protein
MEYTDSDAIDDKPPSRWSVIFSWPSFFFIAWLIYELTSRASLGVTFLCSKFGWEYFRTALWLRRTDPDNTRGKIAFWIFAAGGLWRAAIAGTVLMFVFASLHGADNKQGQPQGPPKEFVEALLVAFFGFLISGIATLRALGLALWHGKKIWLDAGVHEFRKTGAWPPTTMGENKAGAVLLTSLFVVAFPIVCAACAVLVSNIGAMGPGKDAFPLILVVGAFLVLPIALLGGRDFLQRKVLARDATECWSLAPQLSDERHDDQHNL